VLCKIMQIVLCKIMQIAVHALYRANCACSVFSELYHCSTGIVLCKIMQIMSCKIMQIEVQALHHCCAKWSVCSEMQAPDRHSDCSKCQQ
jgi:hypothetical protein